MKKNKIIYWVSTLIIVIVMLLGGVVDILQPDDFASNVSALGYPLYFFVLLGVCKVIGALLLVIPKVPLKLKELAYAGFLFDLVFAALSHIAIGETTEIAAPVLFLVVLFVSYRYWNKINNHQT